MNLPCIENKCILFPVCRHKQQIACKELHNYVRTELNTFPQSTATVWTDIHIIIPNLCEVTSREEHKFK